MVREMKGREVTQELQVMISGLENGIGKWNKIILLKMPSLGPLGLLTTLVLVLSKTRDLVHKICAWQGGG